MTATLPPALGARLPVVRDHYAQVVVGDGAGHGRSRQNYQPTQQILTGELLPRRGAATPAINPDAPRPAVFAAPSGFGPRAGAIAAYTENAMGVGQYRPSIDIRI